MKILVFDNYDSFTYNLVHLVEKIVPYTADVFRNDELPLEEIKKYDKIILSPGPGLPEDAGLLLPLLTQYAASKSILGVCLGHQAIGVHFGGTLVNLQHVLHGVSTNCHLLHKNTGLFTGFPKIFEAGHYHSWAVSDDNFPGELEVLARDEAGNIMAMQHKYFDIKGVQFHPESVLTPMGEKLMKNWLKS